jgi:hypothetical protein
MRLPHALEELNRLVTNATMCWDNQTNIHIPYNHQIGDQSKYIDVAYHVVYENVESAQISFL